MANAMGAPPPPPAGLNVRSWLPRAELTALALAFGVLALLALHTASWDLSGGLSVISAIGVEGALAVVLVVGMLAVAPTAGFVAGVWMWPRLAATTWGAGFEHRQLRKTLLLLGGPAFIVFIVVSAVSPALIAQVLTTEYSLAGYAGLTGLALLTGLWRGATAQGRWEMLFWAVGGTFVLGAFGVSAFLNFGSLLPLEIVAVCDPRDPGADSCALAGYVTGESDAFIEMVLADGGLVVSLSVGEVLDRVPCSARSVPLSSALPGDADLFRAACEAEGVILGGRRADQVAAAYQEVQQALQANDVDEVVARLHPDVDREFASCRTALRAWLGDRDRPYDVVADDISVVDPEWSTKRLGFRPAGSVYELLVNNRARRWLVNPFDHRMRVDHVAVDGSGVWLLPDLDECRA